MYLHKTKNGHYTPPCCYFSGELEVVAGLHQRLSDGRKNTYDEKQKIVLQCFNASENADFIKIGNAATEKEMNAEISFLQQKRVYSTFDIPQLLGSISRADGNNKNQERSVKEKTSWCTGKG